MAQVIQCYEPSGRPVRSTLSLEEGEGFAVYILPDTVTEGRGLRSTLMRKKGELAPPGTILLFDVDMAEPGRGPGMRVGTTGPIPVDMIRPDIRSRVTQGMEIKNGSRFEATLPDRQVILFSVALEAQVVQGAKASVGGGGSTSLEAASAHASLFWMVPTTIQVMAAPLMTIKNKALEMLKKLGISPQMFATLMLVGTMVGTSVLIAVMSYLRAQKAEAAAAEAAEEMSDIAAAKEQALASEAACIADRKSLAKKVDDAELQRAIQIEEALAISLTRTVAAEAGGSKMAAPSLAAFDQLSLDANRKEIDGAMLKLTAPPKETERCATLDTVLAQDLPAYILFWHPDAKLVCPTAYEVVVDNVSRKGAFGLSERLSKEFAQATTREAADAQIDAAGFDPRDVDRLSAEILAAGLRAVRKTVLTTDLGERAPLVPSELYLWTLAIFDAANGMPMSASGENKPTSECVAAFLREASTQGSASAPGQPVLPPLASVASGTLPLVATPNADCPWPSNAMQTGAQAALRSVANYALYSQAQE